MGATVMLMGVGMSAVGQMASAKSQAGALKGQAGVSEYNAAISRQNAKTALDVSSAQQLQQRRSARQQLARERAFGAQSGTGEGGTNADLLEQSETLAELDALNIAYEGEVRARGFLAQSDIDTYNAGLYRKQAKNVKRAGYLSTVGTLAGGVANYKPVNAYTPLGGMSSTPFLGSAGWGNV